MQYHLCVLDTAQGAQSKEGFVFQALFLSTQGLEQVFTADRTGSTAMHATEVVRQQAFPAQGFGVGKGGLLKVARGQGAKTVKHCQVGHGANLAVLGGQRAQAAVPQ